MCKFIKVDVKNVFARKKYDMKFKSTVTLIVWEFT